jgi:hypothetical protein
MGLSVALKKKKENRRRIEED